ncbi:MAG: phage holin family protein [Patescibacteria group bacterium]
MRWLAKIITAIAINMVALWATTAYVTGFKIEDGFREVAIIAVILTALNFILKPVLKLVLGPIIVLTLGLGIILVNAVVLYILDITSQNLTIENVPSLLYGTLIIGTINLIFHMALKNK